MRMRSTLVALAGAVVVAAAALAWTGSRGSPANAAARRPLASSIRPGDFVPHVTNPFFPLKPGTLLVYRGSEGGQVQIDRVFVTYETKVILGVRTTVVRDIIRHHGHVLEKTFDWYAQDKEGNVWYFGENTKSFENGRVNTEGSWQAGVDGARPGILMEADPRPPDAYRQEFYKGHAEDMAWVLKRGGSLSVPYGRIRHILVTMEWTRLEPMVVGKKVYARGFGIVREITVAGPLEINELVRVRRP